MTTLMYVSAAIVCIFGIVSTLLVLAAVTLQWWDARGKETQWRD